MFNKIYMVIVEDDKKVDKMLKIAANNHLYAAYKIGVYGAEKQHEIWIKGRPWNYHQFKEDIKAL